MPRLLRAEAKKAGPPARAKSVIFLYQFGGPSHLDTFDMKPDAPDGYRGPYKPIATKAPGIEICEKLPRTATVMDKVTLIRSMHHPMKNHNSASYYALTGHAPPVDDIRLKDSLELFPAYGSVVDRLAPATRRHADVRGLSLRDSRRRRHAGTARQFPRQGARSAAGDGRPQRSRISTCRS